MHKFLNPGAACGSADNCTATKRGHQTQRPTTHLIVAVWRQAHMTLQRKERAGGGSDKPLLPVNTQ